MEVGREQTLAIVLSALDIQAHVARSRGLRRQILAQDPTLQWGIQGAHHMWRSIETMHERVLAVRATSTGVLWGRYASVAVAVLHLKIGVPIHTALAVGLGLVLVRSGRLGV